MLMLRKTAPKNTLLQPGLFPAHLRLNPDGAILSPAQSPSAQKPLSKPPAAGLASQPPKRSFARKHCLKIATAAAVALFIYDQRDNIQPDEARALYHRLIWLASYYADKMVAVLLIGAAVGGVAKMLLSRAAKNKPNNADGKSPE